MNQSREINTFLIKYYLLGMFMMMSFVGPFIMIIVNQGIPNAFDITVLLAMFSVVRITLGVPSGAFADRFGRKKTAIIAELSAILAFIFLLLRRNYLDFTLYYLFLGLYNTLIFGALEALLYDNMKKLGIAKNYARYTAKKIALGNITFALISLLDFYLIRFGYNAVIIATILTSCFGPLLVILTIKDTHMHDKNIIKLSGDYLKVLKHGLTYSFRHATILKFILFMVLLNSFVYLIDNYDELIWFHITNNLQMVPILIAIEFGFSAFPQLFITKHFQCKRTIFAIIITVIGSISILIGFVFYSFPISFILFIVFLSLFNIIFAILNAKKQSLIPSKIRATVNSVEGFLFGVMGIIYFLFFGYIVNISSYKIGFIVVSGINLFIILVFLYILGYDKHLRKIESRDEK